MRLLLVRGLGNAKNLMKLTRGEHVRNDVTSTNEFAVDIELRDSGPVGVDLDTLAQSRGLKHIASLVRNV